MLFFPVFIRGLGMLVVIIAFALFSVEDLNPKFLLSNAFFPDTEPFGAGADYGNFVLQQRALPPAAKVHAFVIGNPDDGRPAGGIAVLPIVE